MLVVSAFIVFDEIRELPFNFSLFVFLTHRAHGDQNEAAPSRPKIMVVGVTILFRRRMSIRCLSMIL
jgi:hypothetical protein